MDVNSVYFYIDDYLFDNQKSLPSLLETLKSSGIVEKIDNFVTTFLKNQKEKTNFYLKINEKFLNLELAKCKFSSQENNCSLISFTPYEAIDDNYRNGSEERLFPQASVPCRATISWKISIEEKEVLSLFENILLATMKIDGKRNSMVDIESYRHCLLAQYST